MPYRCRESFVDQIVYHGAQQVAKFAVNLVAGCDSEVYHQLQWPRNKVAMDQASWIYVPGDKKAWPIVPRLWHNALVQAVDHVEFIELQEAHPSGVQAIAYKIKDKVRVGVLPETHQFSDVQAGSETEVSQLLAVAMRLGRGEAIVDMGLYLAQEQRMITPTNICLLENSIAIGNLPSVYPGVWLF